MSLQGSALVQVFNGLNLEEKRKLIFELMKNAQLLTTTLPTEEHDFVRFLSRGFEQITFELYEKTKQIWDHVTQQITRVLGTAHADVYIYKEPYGNFDKSKIKTYITKRGPYDLKLRNYKIINYISLMEIFLSDEPFVLLRKSGW